MTGMHRHMILWCIINVLPNLVQLCFLKVFLSSLASALIDLPPLYLINPEILLSPVADRAPDWAS